jgi:Glucodextranase, domain B/PASTA domain
VSLVLPADGTTTLAPTVLVRGTVVSPSLATVLVAGRRARVSGATFSAQVPIAPGSNVIDVLAGARGANAAMSAVRVYRELPVNVPDVTGQSISAATEQLRRLGLSAKVYDETNFFQRLLPISTQVCTMDPPAATAVAPGSAVALEVAKVC